MAAHPIVAAKRRRVIDALKEGKTKTEIAAREQISRKTVRRWQARYQEHGEDWLLDRVSRRQPAMPNQTPLEVELAIVDYALAHPEAGPRTIAAALRAEHGVGVTAVYGTLKRRGLETRAKRLEELRRRSGQTEPDEVERDRLLSKKRHLKAPEPGYLAGADTALVGRLKEAGIVHLAAAIDVHSSYGTAILAPARNGEMAAAALERLRKELSEEGVTKTDRVLTDNGTEFKGRPSHPFEALCRRLGAKHRYTKVRHAWTNGKAERFVQTLKEALEGMLRAKHYGSIAELQADLDEWLEWYNTQRPHQGRYNRGRPPLQVIREFRAQQDLKAA